MEYKTFPSIEIEKIGVSDVGSMVEETLRQLLMMKYYGEYYDNDSDDEEEEVNDNNNNKKKKRAMSGKNSGRDIDDLEDGQDENDEYDSDDEEDRQGEEEDEEEEQKLKMDPEFFLKIHSDDLESWVNDVQHLASVYARQFNNKKTVKITIRQQSLASNKNKKQQKPVVSTIEERFLFASYLGNGCGVRWFRSEEPNVQIELPPYSIGIRAKPSSVVYDLTRESSLAPHGLGIILIIQ